MKFKSIIAIVAILFAACSNNAVSTQTAEVKVWGNCGMCKKTIEKSLKVEGVEKADWNKDTKMLSVTFDTTKITLNQIAKHVADAGYDNDKYKGDDAAYTNLHECCQYERK